MTFERVKGSEADRHDARARRQPAPGRQSHAAGPTKSLGWFRLFMLRHHANAMLRRTLRPPQRIELDGLSPHLRMDLGLPPDWRS